MATCAVIDNNNTVINLIVADVTDPPPLDCKLANKPDNVFVDIGFTWDGTNFFDKEKNICLPVILEEQPTGLE